MYTFYGNTIIFGDIPYPTPFLLRFLASQFCVKSPVVFVPLLSKVGFSGRPSFPPFTSHSLSSSPAVPREAGVADDGGGFCHFLPTSIPQNALLNSQSDFLFENKLLVIFIPGRGGCRVAHLPSPFSPSSRTLPAPRHRKGPTFLPWDTVFLFLHLAVEKSSFIANSHRLTDNEINIGFRQRKMPIFKQHKVRWVKVNEGPS